MTELQLKQNLIEEIATNTKRIEKDSYWYDVDGTLREMDLSDLEFPTYTEDEMIALSGRKWKERFRLLIPFVTHFQYLTSNKRVTALMLNQNGWLAQTYGSQRNGCNVLKYAIDLGLIAPAVTKKRFNCKHSYGYIYGWNKDAQHKISNIIKKFSLINEDRSKDSNISLLETFEKNHSEMGMSKLEFDRLVSAVRFDSDLKINATDEQILKALSVKYPILKDIIKDVAEENKYLPSDEQMKAVPTIHRSEKHHLVTKIGFRITNPYVSLKEHDNGKNYNGKWRKEYMDEKFGVGNWECFDVKSSVPRVTYLLNKGEWLDNEIDLYALMFNEGREFPYPICRDWCKKAFMRFYFDRSTSRISNRLRRMHLIDDFINDFGYSEGVVPTVDAIKKDIWKAIGESYKSEIFLYESYLYLQIFKALRLEGAHPKQIYDGFYFEKNLNLQNKLSDLFKREAKRMIMHISLLETFGKKVPNPSKTIAKAHSQTNSNQQKDIQNEKHTENHRSNIRTDAQIIPPAASSDNRRMVRSQSSIRIGGTVQLDDVEQRKRAIQQFNQSKDLIKSFIFGKISREDAESQYYNNTKPKEVYNI